MTQDAGNLGELRWTVFADDSQLDAQLESAYQKVQAWSARVRAIAHPSLDIGGDPGTSGAATATSTTTTLTLRGDASELYTVLEESRRRINAMREEAERPIRIARQARYGVAEDELSESPRTASRRAYRDYAAAPGIIARRSPLEDEGRQPFVGRGSEQRLEVTADTSQAEQRVTGVQRYLQDLRTVSAKPIIVAMDFRDVESGETIARENRPDALRRAIRSKITAGEFIDAESRTRVVRSRVLPAPEAPAAGGAGGGGSGGEPPDILPAGGAEDEGPQPQPVPQRPRGRSPLLYRFLAIASIREGLRALESDRQYGIEEVLAGNDPRAQIEAQLRQRQRLTSGFVGGVVGLAQDPGGGAEAEIRAILGTAQATDQRTAAITGTGRFLAGLREQSLEAAAGPGFTAQRTALDTEVRQRREAVKDERDKSTKAIDDQVEAERVRLAAVRKRTYEEDITPFAEASNEATRARRDAQEQRDITAVAQYRHQLTVNQDRRFKPTEDEIAVIEKAGRAAIDRQEALSNLRYGTAERSALLRARDLTGNAAFENVKGAAEAEYIAAPPEEKVNAARAGAAKFLDFAAELGRKFTDTRQDLLGEGNVLRARLRGDPLAAATAEIEAQRERAQRAVPKFELFGFDLFSPIRSLIDENARTRRAISHRELVEEPQEDVRGDTAVIRAELARQPLQAQLLSLDVERQRARRNQPAEVQADIDTDYAARADLARQRAQDRFIDTDVGLAGEREQLQTLLSSHGRNRVGAEAIGIGVQGFLRSRQLEEEGQPGQAREALQNSLLQEQLLKQSFLEGFHGEAVDTRLFSITNARDQIDPQAIIAKLDEQTQRIERALANLGSD